MQGCLQKITFPGIFRVKEVQQLDGALACIKHENQAPEDIPKAQTDGRYNPLRCSC